MRRIISDAAIAALVLGCGAVLILAGMQVGSGLTWPPHSYEHWLAILSLGAGAVVLCWLVLGLAAAAAAALLAKTGHWQIAALFAALSPVFLRRLAGAVVGLNLAMVPAAHAVTAAEVAVPAGGVFSDAAAVDPQWQPAGTSNRGPAVDPLWQPAPPAAAPGIVAKPITRNTPEGVQTVTVTSGDSLWHLAAAELGPLATDIEIAERWPDWHTANRAVIGDDPSLIRPGQTLIVPPSR